MEDMTTKELRKFYDLIEEQVDRGDFAAAMMAHNIVLEGMAYPIYRYEAAYWSIFDPSLTQLIRGAFAVVCVANVGVFTVLSNCRNWV